MISFSTASSDVPLLPMTSFSQNLNNPPSANLAPNMSARQRKLAALAGAAKDLHPKKTDEATEDTKMSSALIDRKGTLPLNELDDERAEKEVEYRINSSTTIIEVAAVLGGFSFDRFMSCNEFEEAFGAAHPKAFWSFVMATFLSFAFNMITVAAMSIELYVTNRLLSKNVFKAAQFARDMSGVRRIAVASSFISVPCLLIAVISYAMMAFGESTGIFTLFGLLFLSVMMAMFWRMQQLALKQDYSIVGGWYLRITGQRKSKYL